MDTELTFLGYSIKKETLPAHFLENIRRELYVKPIENPNFPSNESAYPVFRIFKNNVYVPRYYGITNYGPPKKISLQEGEDISVDFVGSLRPIQETTIEETVKNYNLYGGGIVSLDTGLGKTVVALKLISLMKKKALIIVHAEFLLEQWIERIKTFLPTARIGVIRQDKCKYDECDIVVGMLQSIIKRDYPVECFKSFGSLIVDECFPYRQLICTENGPMEIGAIYNMWKNNKIVPKILSFNEKTGETEYKNMRYGWERNNENLLKISYSKSNIKCTQNHKILTNNGYIAACDLKVGDLIKCNINNNIKENMVARTLNEDQYQILLGSFLGDGYVETLPSKRYRLSVIHSEKQKEYCEWKASMFNCTIKKIDSNGYAQKPAYSFCTKVIDSQKDFPTKKSTCPQWILDDLDYKALSIWWMDDGYLSKSQCNGTLSTCSFDEESHIRIVNKLISMGIDCSYRGDGHGYLSIYISKKGIYAMLKKIRKYLHPNIKYKFYNNFLETAKNEYYNGDTYTIYTNILNINPIHLKEGNVINGRLFKMCNNIHNNTLHSGYKCYNCKNKYNYSPLEPPNDCELYEWNNKMLNYGTVKITSIENVKNKSNNSHVYDIEVEDNHNFICSTINSTGPIVHNCHHIGSRTFSSIFFKVQTKYMLGLSATPERKDGLSKVIYWFLGPQIVNIKRDINKPKIQFVINDCSDYEEKFNSVGKVNNPIMITELTLKDSRNKLILSTVKEYLKEERKILILSDRRAQCEYLNSELIKDGISSGVYLGGMKTESRTLSVNSSVIIGTYQASGEGFDVPDLDTLILATPKSDVQQAVGRILRQKNKNDPIVIDIVDPFSIFKGQYQKRKKFYKNCNFVII